MNKKLCAKMIMDSLKGSGRNYRVLNELNGSPQHVRIDGFGDVYPATGTWLDIENKWHRKDPESFVTAIAGKFKTAGSKTGKLEKRVNDLEEHVAWLEDELSKLKANVFPLG